MKTFLWWLCTCTALLVIGAVHFINPLLDKEEEEEE